MVQIIINLDDHEDKFLNIYKAKKGIKSKSMAIKEILKEFEEKYLDELELNYCSRMSEKSFAKNWLSSEDEVAYSHLKDLIKDE